MSKRRGRFYTFWNGRLFFSLCPRLQGPQCSAVRRAVCTSAAPEWVVASGCGACSVTGPAYDGSMNRNSLYPDENQPQEGRVHLGVWEWDYILFFSRCFISQNCQSPANVLSVKNNKEYEKPIFTEHWTLQNNLQLLSDISKPTRKTLALDWAISHLDSSAHPLSPQWSCVSEEPGQGVYELHWIGGIQMVEKIGDVAKLIVRCSEAEGLLLHQDLKE